MLDNFLGIPSSGWIAIAIWLTVNVVPWIYSLFFVHKINQSGVERWGAKKPKNS
ncbi:hypothetical protein [Salinibacillus xinjiangensis]|uniref:Uncharacterized protein n=1 Tax=Salinibacillus xinjiangensis TaxID=1229268 RepID=A0A6G1X9J2_9BACI|nr:hypothetical protein [Salinibacillus xinjiangensis]MRG87575.1 hypothetical protein [Salinibacillus xinjiangensis]